MGLIEKSEQDWQAESDAETLAQADEIRSDKNRMQRAADAAKKMEDAAKQRARKYKKIAKRAKSSKKAGGVKLSEW